MTVRQQIEGEQTQMDAPPAYTPQPEPATASPLDTLEGAVAMLGAATPDDEVRTRMSMGKGGQPVMRNGAPMMLPYITARYVQTRLDQAVGPSNWQTEFTDVQGGVRCGIGIRFPGSEGFIWKYDAAPYTNIEAIKGGHSDAFKRAAVHWGIARDLYDLSDDSEALVAEQPMQAQPQQGGVVAVPQGQTYIQPQQQQAYGQQPMGMQPQGMVNGAPAWVCPIHNDNRIVPAGFSQRTQRNYPAFYACSIPGCDQKGPSVA